MGTLLWIIKLRILGLIDFSNWSKLYWLLNTRSATPLWRRRNATLLGYFRDCKNARCRRARCCLVPQPCYWDRKLAMPAEQWARFEKLCKPIRALLPIGSRKGSVGLWLF